MTTACPECGEAYAVRARVCGRCGAARRGPQRKRPPCPRCGYHTTTPFVADERRSRRILRKCSRCAHTFDGGDDPPREGPFAALGQGVDGLARLGVVVAALALVALALLMRAAGR
ncbi:MAG: hypothetical protein M9894_31480 [Planctomycetes bacterium]|nr:hypothetical protein [Planctomycetota bacterium]